MFADLRCKNAFWLKRWWGGMMVGGRFQLYDGIIQHKLMKIHQIRYVENVLIYDLIWNILAIVITLIGILIVFRTRREKPLRCKIVDEL